ncbi:MAG: sugar phosphate isomerase/epimerase [Anaerolineales bacterium]|uniref:sugar phosphate isomerase/epimerase family protein n=1 Tax=Candidatus Villigracilis proximus TaxID=3140683 RepID=UPI0031362E13|nr:sugar phosphate isomerase/epimerase [Anaerolineales bacterium]
MKLGFFTAALPNNTLEQAAQWGAESEFQAIEIACWPQQKASRRYAGVTHIDVTDLTPAKAKEIRAMLDGFGLQISSLGYYSNPLHPEAEHRETVIAHLKQVIAGAALLEVPIVGTFIGKDKNKTIEQNLEEYAKVWMPIVQFAKERGIKIAIENCPMLFSYDEWPGGNNLASTPAIWRKMWEIIPDEHFGLNLDPSHLILQMIDYERVVREFSSRIFHVHAKDLHIDREGLYQHGALSQGMGWQVPRLPGLGDMNWGKFFAALTAARYDDVVSIEHEDRAFEGDENLVKRGFYIARDTLKPYIH